MTKNREILDDKWFRLAGIPLAALFSSFLFFYDINTANGFSFLQGYLHSVVEASIIWSAARQVIIYTRKEYSTFENSAKRIKFTFLYTSLVTTIVMAIICAIYDTTKYWGYHFTIQKYIYNIMVALLFSGIVYGIYESIYFFKKWSEAFVEGEALKKENLQSQLDSLKAQINPHFLFNSLSSLSSLIAEDSKRAEVFVDELSTVYRYVLQTNDKDLTTLKSEFDFINAYYHLLKTRFAEGIVLVLDVEPDYYSYSLPPLTLQLLIENAVKHNVILPDKPLTIRIYVSDATNLVIENNLQKKSKEVTSNKMGLSNIIRKYKLLKQPDVLVSATDDSFKVEIPLIKNEVYEYTDSRR